MHISPCAPPCPAQSSKCRSVWKSCGRRTKPYLKETVSVLTGCCCCCCCPAGGPFFPPVCLVAQGACSSVWLSVHCEDNHYYAERSGERLCCLSHCCWPFFFFFSSLLASTSDFEGRRQRELRALIFFFFPVRQLGGLWAWRQGKEEREGGKGVKEEVRRKVYLII